MNEAQIINGLRLRETKAFDAVFNELFRPLCFFATQIVRDHEEAKDIAIESFVRFWEKENAFESMGQVRGFLYNVTRNACLNYIDKQRSRQNYNKELLYLSKEAQENTTEKLQMQATVLEIILKEIDRLPKKSREVFKLSYINQLSYREIATSLNITESTARSHYNTAIKALRLAFTEKELFVLLALVRVCQN